MDFKTQILRASILILMGKVWTQEVNKKTVFGYWSVDGRCLDTGAWWTAGVWMGGVWILECGGLVVCGWAVFGHWSMDGCVWTVNKETSDVYERVGRGIGPCGRNLKDLVRWLLMMSCLVK